MSTPNINPNSSSLPPPPPPSQPPRKFPSPCWTHDETLALIDSYRDKWYSLRRGHLRSSDWESVASSVASLCPSTPPKSSAQCRHKIEKLRKRYRTEKQRSLSSSYPGLFFSSWLFYDKMDSMESLESNSHDPITQILKKPLKFDPDLKIPKFQKTPNFETVRRSPNLELNKMKMKKIRKVEEDDDVMRMMVRSIRMIGEGYAKMERMKMEMAREMERVRLEMELRRSQLILESQHQIFDAVLMGFLDSKKRKKTS
ncbi:Myb/SANT-like DNA-binding domain 4 [Dillenia turbinata]|uniref:Myb/SANT-like DNA-binding domain 4 n=1 Tax=Dillenia turbinata TaxID=194707 RepID=A0AAN8VJ92_9MAGN